MNSHNTASMNDEDLDAERLARAGLSRVTEADDYPARLGLETFGAVRLWELIMGSTPLPEEHTSYREAVEQAYGSNARAHRHSKLEHALQRWASRRDQSSPERDLAFITSQGGGFLIPGDPGWPEALNDLGESTPYGLWWRGSQAVPTNTKSCVAVVGTRDPTPYGEHVTREYTAELAERGATIISGGALGVDALAHRTALEHSLAPLATAVVLAGGVDRLYPAANRALLERIGTEHVIVSEAAPGASPMRWRFLARNRIIAALSRGILVTEGRHRSGAISTAVHGLEIGRWVGAIPGPVTSAASAGPHRLIRDYPVELVASATQLCETLGFSTNTQATHAQAGQTPALFGSDPAPAAARLTDGLTALEQRIVEALSPRTYRNLDEVFAIAGLSVPEAMPVLSQLHRRGLAVQRGQMWKRGKIGP